MQRKTLLKILTLFLVLNVVHVNAQHETEHTESTELSLKESQKLERKEYIQHHLLDSYDFNLFSYKKDNGEKAHVGFPLPIILLDNGLQIFSSSKFHHF
jgi:F-type H+-transporting ATPase subunit a